MKSFQKTAAQGEISIRRIGAVPASVKPFERENGAFIVGHSETGHHHVLERDAGVQMFSEPDRGDGMHVLYAVLDAANALVHQRGHDTHETISLEPGIYEFRLGREYDPYAELARRVAD